MRNSYLIGMVVLVAVMLAITAITPACAAIQKSIYLMEVSNHSLIYANGFHIFLRGVRMADIDPSGYFDSNYGRRTAFEDPQGVHIYWENGYTSNYSSDMFGFTLLRDVSFFGCDIFWMKDGQIIGQVGNVPQDWRIVGSDIWGTIYNRTDSTQWVRRTAGYSAGTFTMSDLALNNTPPNPVNIDSPTSPPTEIALGSPLSFSYAPYAGFKTYLMYYDYYNAIGAMPAVRFRNAAIVGASTGSLEFNVDVHLEDGSRIWHPSLGPAPRIPVLDFSVSADRAEDVKLSSLSLYPDNGASSPTDIASVEIWKDVDNDGAVNTSVDDKLAAGSFSAMGELVLNLAPAPIIPAGGRMDLLVTCTLVSPLPSVGNRYDFEIGNANGQGMASLQPPIISGLSINSADIYIAPDPISIGQAKQMPINPASGMSDLVYLENKVAVADFQSTMRLAYMEEENRSAGIGIELTPEDSPGLISEGMRCSVVGYLKLRNNAELIFVPVGGKLEPGNPIKPLGMSNSLIGGKAFGSQPAVMDNAGAPGASMAMNNIGMLVKTWGTVTGFGSLIVDGATYDAMWFDDGSGMKDGLSQYPGIAVLKPADQPQGIEAPSGMCSITGIIRTIPGPSGAPVRLLVPRSFSGLQLIGGNSSTTLSGKVLRTVGTTRTTTPVPGVKVTIGNPPASGYSDENGQFTIELKGRAGSRLPQEISPLVFSVDVSGANVPAGYPTFLKALHLDYTGPNPTVYLWTSKTALPIPPAVYNPDTLSTDLGTIYVDYYNEAPTDGTLPRLLDPDEYENDGGDVPLPPSF